jgi:hypothetical protein
MPDREHIAVVMERVRTRYTSWVEGARTAPCVWEIVEDTLRWDVVLRVVVEPDIDVEVRPDALVVPAALGRAMVLAILPVPEPYDPHRARLRFQSGVLHVRVGP